MSKGKKTASNFWKILRMKGSEGPCLNGIGMVRGGAFLSMVLLLMYSLVFHNFIIILVILLQAIILLGTYTD